MTLLLCLMGFFGDAGGLTDIGYIVDAAIVHDEVYLVDINAHRVWITNLNGKVLSSFGRQGEGPGEFYYPETITVRGGRLWIGGRASRQLQEFDLNGNSFDKVIRWGFGAPCDWVDDDVLLVKGLQDGKMLHLFDMSANQFVSHFAMASKEHRINHGVKGDFIGAWCPRNRRFIYGDSVKLDLHLFDETGKELGTLRQDWSGLNPWAGSKAIEYENQDSWLNSLDNFMPAGCFVFTGSRGREFFFVTWEPQNWTSSYIVEVLDIETRDLVYREDGERFPLAVSSNSVVFYNDDDATPSLISQDLPSLGL